MNRPLSRYTTLGITFSLLLGLAPRVASGENWPAWRGPRGDGSSLDEQAPTRWDGASGHHIQWKVPLPGGGHSSPIVWNDRIFVTSCIPETKERVLICLDLTSGNEIWRRMVLRAPLESKHALNSYASSTPATDGQLVYATFLEVGTKQVEAPNVSDARWIFPGQMVVAAYDFEGNQQWLVRPGEFLSAHGFCSNPVAFGDKLIINGDHDGDSYIVALDRQTGDTIWKTPRRHRTRSYGTPLLRDVDGQVQMVLAGSKCVTSFDPDTGKRKWSVEGPTEQFVASVVTDGFRFFAVGGYPTHHVMAIRPDGVGDVGASHVLWHVTNARCYVPSPVVVGDYLVVADDRGTAGCFDTATGMRHWQARMGQHFSASLLTANGLVYFFADDGKTKIIRPGPELELVAQSELGENLIATPALSQGRLLIRSQQHLYCIRKSSRNDG